MYPEFKDDDIHKYGDNLFLDIFNALSRGREIKFYLCSKYIVHTVTLSLCIERLSHSTLKRNHELPPNDEEKAGVLELFLDHPNLLYQNARWHY